VYYLLTNNQQFQIIGLDWIRIQGDSLTCAQQTKFIKMLATDSSLSKIYFHSLELTASDLELLCKSLESNQSITNLEFFDCLVEDYQWLAELLKVNQHLTTLSLQHHKLTTAHCRQLGESLKINQSLTYLELYFADINTEGCKWLSESLKENKTLTSLSLQYNAIDFNCVSDMLKANQTLTLLNVDEREPNPEGFRLLRESMKVNRSLTELYFYFNDKDEMEYTTEFTKSNMIRKKVMLSQLLAFRIILLSGDKGSFSYLPVELLQRIVHQIGYVYLVSFDQVRKIYDFALKRETLCQHNDGNAERAKIFHHKKRAQFFNAVFY
jgi:hypothetical protein